MSVAAVWEEKIQGLLKDFSRTFNSLAKTYSVDVLPSYRVFSDDDFREYAMFLASHKTINSIRFAYWILDLGNECTLLT